MVYSYFYKVLIQMNNLLSQLKNKIFWRHLTGAILSALLITVLIFLSFRWYTHHNESIDVPDLSGLSIEDATRILEENNLRLETIDSVYEVPEELESVKPGGVIDQNPSVGEKVKRNRRFYIVVRSSTPPMVEMPNLIDLSLRQSIGILEAKGLKFGVAIKKPGLPPVMKQLYKGRNIDKGTKIPKGSVIDLWVGEGGSDVRVAIPNLIGLKRNEAISALTTLNLNIGAEIFTADVTDSSKAVVIRQSPPSSEEPSMPEGSDVDLWYGN
jgi:beta-lactam-binding protein with PASTA domain